MKKSIFIAGIFLLLFGCVLAAGCTGTVNLDEPADIWVSSDLSDSGMKTQSVYFYADGTGKKVTEYPGEATKTRLFTWEQAGKYYTLKFTGDTDVDTFTLTGGKLLHDNSFYTKEKSYLPENTTSEPASDTLIVGTWVYDDGIKTLTFNSDGSGIRTKIENKLKTKDFEWKKTGSHYYTMFFDNGEDDTLSLENGKIIVDGEIYTRSP